MFPKNQTQWREVQPRPSASHLRQDEQRNRHPRIREQRPKIGLGGEQKHEATARKLYEEEKTKVTAKNIEIRTLEEQLADFPKRGKDGKFVKNND